MNSLELIKLNKHYGRKHALKNFSFTFTNGIYGLLGPNGAGKSTLMHLITGILHPDKGGGSINWNGNRYINWASLTVNILDLCRSSRNCTVI